MTTSRPPLAKLLASARHWLRLADGSYVARPVLSIHGFGYDVSREELAERHPLLPYIIDNLCTPFQNFVTQPYAQAELVFETLRAIEHKVIVVENLDQHLLYFASMSSFGAHADNADLVTLVGRVLTFAGPAELGPVLPYVSRVDVEMHHVERSYLDMRYPGWCERWTAAQALGLKDYALTKYIFVQAPAVPDLPVHVVFDSVC